MPRRSPIAPSNAVLAGLLGASVLATACDPAPENGDPMEDGAADDDAENADGGADPADGGSADDGSGDDPGSDDGPVNHDGPDSDDGFDNAFDAVATHLDGMTFYCNAGDAGGYNVTLQTGGDLHVAPDDGGALGGRWDATGDTLTLEVPDTAFAESSIAHEIELGLLLTFRTPSLFCHAVALRPSTGEGSTTLGCPTIKYIPGVGYEDNQFILSGDGQARRRRWKELSGEFSDTLYTEMYGVWVLEGDALYMAFGDGNPDEERLLVGAVTNEGVLIEQLEPETGACTEA